MLRRMFCQSCGAQNSDDAKFCNQCGAKIARVGEAGGPLPSATVPEQQPPAAVAAAAAKSRNHPGETAVGVGMPPAAAAPPGDLSGVKPNAYHPDTGFGGQSMLGVSLAGIGVRSNKKTWATIVFIALALVALGAVGSWLARGEPEVVAEAGHAEPDDPFVIGTPLPEGEDEPDIVPGATGDPTMLGTPTMSTSGSMTAAMTSGSMTTSTSGSMTASMTSTTMRTSPTMTSTMTSAMTTTMGTTAMETTTMDPTDTTMETTMETTTMESTSSMQGPGEELPEERDLEMELYSSRVRFVIRRYYAARAQACFDRATRNNPTVSGTVVVNMTIGDDGAVSRSRVGRNTTGDTSLGNCLENQVSTWRLPPPPGGSLDMQMPFSR